MNAPRDPDMAPMLSLFWTVTVRAPTSRTSGRILPELDPRSYLGFIDAASVDVPRVQVLLQAENSGIYSLQPLRRVQRTHTTALTVMLLVDRRWLSIKIDQKCNQNKCIQCIHININVSILTKAIRKCIQKCIQSINPSKTSSPGSRNEQALEANDDHQRRACPQLPCPQYSRALLSLNGAHEAPAAEPAVKMATRAFLLARQPPPTS